MVMIAWPSTLPQTPQHPYSISSTCGVSSEQDELSQARTRTYPEKEATFVFKQLTITQFQALRTFYNVTLNQTLPFSVPWKDLIHSNSYFCQFLEPPKISIEGVGYNASIRVLLIATVPVNEANQIIYGAT